MLTLDRHSLSVHLRHEAAATNANYSLKSTNVITIQNNKDGYIEKIFTGHHKSGFSLIIFKEGKWQMMDTAMIRTTITLAHHVITTQDRFPGQPDRMIRSVPVSTSTLFVLVIVSHLLLKLKKPT